MDIGRYETGNTSSDNPIIKRLTTNQSVQLWYSMYNRLKNISLNKNIRTGMIWGNLWDETLQWMIDTKDKAKEEIVDDSTCWGNYQNSKFLFINTNGQKLLTNSGSASYIPTGSTERNKSNNIYDLAGNMREYTLEGVSTADKRILRGSYYYNSTGGGASSSMLRSSGEPNKKSAPGTSINNYGNIGFRAYMYIK